MMPLLYALQNQRKKFVLLSFLSLCGFAALAQQATADSAANAESRDLVDVLHRILHKKAAKPKDAEPPKKYNLALLPGAGYTLQTGFAVVLTGNVGYYNDSGADAKLSTVSSSITYSQYQQIILPFSANVWTKGGKYNVISDNRYITYPSDIYGLGGRTDPTKGHTINFSAVKFHETVLRQLADNLYAGIGIYYDQFWNIKAVDSNSRRINFLIQRELGGSETAVGPVLRVLYDSRNNPINAQRGFYANVVYRANQTFLGSDAAWQSLQTDARYYFSFPRHSRNTLAFWNFNWLTLGGQPPYLLLPSTAWDDQANTGRGYIQSRFRGKNMRYLETEYRFAVSRNGLFGGVVFANVQNFSPDLSASYDELLPGYGAGIRLKLNKHTATNISLDYGFGLHGSKGLFVNLGEMF